MRGPDIKVLELYQKVGVEGWRVGACSTQTSENPSVRSWIAHRLPPARTVLSIGCGSGELEKNLEERGYRVIGIDISSEMLQSASRRGFGRVVQADAHCLPFHPAFFDIVIFAESVGHLKLDDAFREAGNMLTDQGRLIITTYPTHAGVHPLYRIVAHAEITRHLAQAGCHIQEIRFLDTRDNLIVDSHFEDQSTLIYILGVKASL